MAKIIQYAVFPSEEEAARIVAKIDERKPTSGTWGIPNKHPVTDDAIIVVDWSQLQECEDIFDGVELIDRSDAVARGWYFGHFSGTFARERQKLEDMYFILDAITATHGTPNWPALRSLIVSFLSAAYSLRESMRHKVSKDSLRDVFETWWADRMAEMNARHGLLKTFDIYMQAEKHGGPVAGQQPGMLLTPILYAQQLVVTRFPINSDPKSLHYSAEGAFVSINVGTPYERRVPVGIHNAKFDVEIINGPTKHLGKSIEGLPLLKLIQLIIEYYARIVFIAERMIGERSEKESVIQFYQEQNLKTSE